MLHTDIPTLPEIRSLIASRADACISIYLSTTPQTQQVGVSRIAFKNLAKEALQQLQAAEFDKRRLMLLEDEITTIAEDDEFWRTQANSLAVLVTPGGTRTFRLATAVTSMVEVSDRFLLKPLLRAIAFPQHAFVLALSENAVRLVEVFPDEPPITIKVPGLPKSAADSVGRASVNSLPQGTRIADGQGQAGLLKQYTRQVDAALRPVLSGRETPLILAATEPLAPMFRATNSYPALENEGIPTSPDHLKDHELASAARAILDIAYAKTVESSRELYQNRLGQRRATADLEVVALAATNGAVELMLVDIDRIIAGTVDETGNSVVLATVPDATSYDVVDEIVGRAILSGAKILGVRGSDIPGGEPLAAVLRYPI